MLVIDDEPQIRRAVRRAMEAEGCRVIEADTGESALDLVAAERPSLVILDLGLPGLGGVELCRQLRARTAAPIVVLSARHDDSEKVALLDAGADDYVTKPFSTAELQARTRVQLRRSRGGSRDNPMTLDIAGLVLEFARPGAARDDVPIHLTRTEWGVLRVLAAHEGRTVTHRQLWTAVWGHAHGDAAQHLRVHVRSLRRKLERDPMRPALIVTEPGVGYRFEKGS